MSICLSHGSADRMLERCAREGIELEPASSNVLMSVGAQVDEVRNALGDYGPMPFDDVELVVGDRRNVRHSRGIVTHLLQRLPPEGSILRVDDGLYVVSPELCLMQQAGVMHPVNLCQMLGRYLATASSYESQDGKRLNRRSQLTDEERLARFLRGVRGSRGRGVLIDALEWTCPRAASPQETNLQLALTLPPSFGGFGLKRPMMNKEIKLNELERRLCQREFIRIDLLWQGGFGLEYQGEDHANQLDEDYARFLAAHAHGIDIWFVANGQLADPVQMNYIAEHVAMLTGRRARGMRWPKRGEVQWLLEVLAGKRIPDSDDRFARKPSR